MKRWLIVGIPLLLLAALMFVKPPSFTGGAKVGTTPITSTTGKPGIPGGGGDDGGKPKYGGQSKDKY
jgi:hypothetical protein